MEIDNEDEKSVDSFQGEIDLVKKEEEEEEENYISPKERLSKMLEKIESSKNAENNEEPQNNNPDEQKAQVLRGKPNVLRAVPNKASIQKNNVPEPFVSNFKLNERYFYQNININEWNDITNFIDKFISDENSGEKELEEFFENHPKISKGNVLKLQGSIDEIFSKKKDCQKYKLLMNFLIKKYFKPKPVICECYFFPNPSNEQRVVNMFRTCKKTLDIAIFTFTRDSIAQAILEAHQRGLKIRCIGDDGNSKVKGSDVRVLASVGIPCKTDNNLRNHMHNKMAILDNSVVITGSFNWTNQAINKNQDNILFIEDKNIANQYTEYFNQIWNSFDTVITPEEAKKYIEEEKKKSQTTNVNANKNKETTEKKENKKTNEEKEKKPTVKKEKEKTTTTKEKEKANTAKGKTPAKKEKTTNTKGKASSSKGKTTTKEKTSTKGKTEKRSKTMKEIKKGSTTKGKEKVSKSSKVKSEKPKTTKEKKKQKVEKAKNKTTTKRVRGVKSTTKSTTKKKK